MPYIYNVSYDLRRPGQSYQNLYRELKQSPVWWHYLDSTWLIATGESADVLWERLQPHVDANDFILIAEITANYSGWLPEEAWAWIRRVQVYDHD